VESLLGVFGFWLLAVGYWLLGVGCWVLVVGCWLLAVGHSDNEPKPTTNHLSSSLFHHQPLIIDDQLMVVFTTN